MHEAARQGSQSRVRIGNGLPVLSMATGQRSRVQGAPCSVQQRGRLAWPAKSASTARRQEGRVRITATATQCSAVCFACSLCAVLLCKTLPKPSLPLRKPSPATLRATCDLTAPPSTKKRSEYLQRSLTRDGPRPRARQVARQGRWPRWWPLVWRCAHTPNPHAAGRMHLIYVLRVVGCRKDPSSRALWRPCWVPRLLASQAGLIAFGFPLIQPRACKGLNAHG